MASTLSEYSSSKLSWQQPGWHTAPQIPCLQQRVLAAVFSNIWQHQPLSKSKDPAWLLCSPSRWRVQVNPAGLQGIWQEPSQQLGGGSTANPTGIHEQLCSLPDVQALQHMVKLRGNQTHPGGMHDLLGTIAAGGGITTHTHTHTDRDRQQPSSGCRTIRRLQS